MIVSLTGSNSFQLKGEANKIVSEFIKEYGDLALERLDGEEATLPQVLEAVQSIPFLSAKKMVVLRAASSNKELSEAIEQILDSTAETTDLIFYEPQIDKRTSYYKILKKRTEFSELNHPDEQQLYRWAKDYVEALNGSISLSDAALLVRRVGTDQQRLANELDKLVTYNPKITSTTVELLSEESPQSKIFDLLDAAFAGQTKRALSLYEQQRIQKIEPQQILAMIGWQLHSLALVASAGNRPVDVIAREAKLNPFVVRKNMSVVSRLNISKIKRLAADALDIDVKSKNTALNLDEALKSFILEI